MIQRPPPRLKETSFFFFFFKVHQTPLKSKQLSLFVPPVIFGRIPKSLKMVRRSPPRLMKTGFFFFLILKSIKPLWKVSNFHYLSHQLFLEGYLKVWKWTTDHLRALMKTQFYFFIFFKVCQTTLKRMHLSLFVLSVIFGRIRKSLKMVHRPLQRLNEKCFFFFFFLKSVKPLWKVCNFHYLSDQLFSEGYLKAWKWSNDHNCPLMKTILFFIFF